MHVHEQSPTESRGVERSRIRARRTRNRTLGVIISAVVGIGVLFGTIGSASALPSAGDWLKLRTCESGGNYATNTGNGYYGAYQFDLGTWASVGGTGLPSNASPATQDALAYKLWQQRGWTPWTCAQIVGLPVGGSGGPALVAARVVAEHTVGFFDSLELTSDGVHLSVVGWAADLASAGRTTSVRITVNNAVTVVRAASARPDVNRIMHLAGAHGFAASIPAPAGSFRVCVTALGSSAAHNASAGCRTVKVPAALKAWNRVTPSTAGRAVVAGWVYDNTAPGRSVSVVVVVDGRATYRVPANRPSADVDAVFKVSGSHRYNTAIWVGTGRHVLCVYAVGVKATTKRAMGCAAVAIAAPVGVIDRESGSAGRVSVSGWGFDPNSAAASVNMLVVVNGVPHTVPANVPRADVNRVFHVTGNHGFSAVVSGRKGVNSVCVYTIGTLGIAKRLLSCRAVAA